MERVLGDGVHVSGNATAARGRENDLCIEMSCPSCTKSSSPDFSRCSNSPRVEVLCLPNLVVKATEWIHVFRWKIVLSQVVSGRWPCPLANVRCLQSDASWHASVQIWRWIFWCPPAIICGPCPPPTYPTYGPTDVPTWVSLGLKHVKTSSIDKSTYADHWSKRPVWVDHDPEINIIGCTVAEGCRFLAPEGITIKIELTQEKQVIGSY